MRRKVVIIRDDYDGTELAEADVIKRTVTVDGLAHFLDLRAETSALLNSALAPFLEGAETYRKERAWSPPPPPLPPLRLKPPAAEPAPTPAAETATEPEPAAEPLPECPRSDKKIYVSEADAAEAMLADMAHQRPGDEQPEPYLCVCTFWHLGRNARTRERAAQIAAERAGQVVRRQAEAMCPKCSEGPFANLLGHMHKKHPENIVTVPAKLPEAKRAAPRFTSSGTLLPALRTTRPKDTIEPGVFVRHVEGERSERPKPTTSAADPEAMADFDWGSVKDLDGTVLKMRERFRDGLPEALSFDYYPEVLATAGMDLDIVEAALRHPERVEVAGETFDKGWGVLRFHRGDAITCVGFRNPTKPLIIAAYHGSLLEHDKHRVTLGGGGGARKAEGLPKTARQSIDRLRAMGADIAEVDALSTESVVSVFYRGQDLGKVTTSGTAPRTTVESDYQRTLRKLNAIKQRVS